MKPVEHMRACIKAAIERDAAWLAEQAKRAKAKRGKGLRLRPRARHRDDVSTEERDDD